MVNEIQVGGYNALLTKLFSMREGSPAPSLAPEIVPVLVLESDRPEYEFLKGNRLCGSSTTFNLSATSGKVQVFNPVGSGVLAVVRRISLMVDPAAGGPFIAVFGVTTTAVAASGGSPFFRDGRVNPAPTAVPTCTLQQLASTANVNSLWAGTLVSTPGGVIVEAQYEEAIVLPPGWGAVAMSASVLTGALRASFAWTERILDPSETR